MRDDLGTLEMLRQVTVSVRGLRWSLVERVTHLALAVAVGYAIAKSEQSEIQKLEHTARIEVEKRLKDEAFHERLRMRQAGNQSSSRSTPSAHVDPYARTSGN